jgi:hypothetical protein
MTDLPARVAYRVTRAGWQLPTGESTAPILSACWLAPAETAVTAEDEPADGGHSGTAEPCREPGLILSGLAWALL